MSVIEILTLGLQICAIIALMQNKIMSNKRGLIWNDILSFLYFYGTIYGVGMTAIV